MSSQDCGSLGKLLTPKFRGRGFGMTQIWVNVSVCATSVAV